jgi:hypothetical protein
MEKFRLQTTETNQQWYNVRKAALDDWAEQLGLYPNERIARNDQVHEDSVVADLHVIGACRDPVRVVGKGRSIPPTVSPVRSSQERPCPTRYYLRSTKEPTRSQYLMG